MSKIKKDLVEVCEVAKDGLHSFYGLLQKIGSIDLESALSYCKRKITSSVLFIANHLKKIPRLFVYIIIGACGGIYAGCLLVLFIMTPFLLLIIISFSIVAYTYALTLLNDN